MITCLLLNPDAIQGRLVLYPMLLLMDYTVVHDMGMPPEPLNRFPPAFDCCWVAVAFSLGMHGVINMPFQYFDHIKTVNISVLSFDHSII